MMQRWPGWPSRVRSKIALTLAATGLVTAIGVVLTVAVAFQRFERETSYQRANQFLDRVVSLHDNLFDLQMRHPEQLETLLSSLVLFEPDSRLYLLASDGQVLAASVPMTSSGTRVALAPVLQAAKAQRDVPFVMGDDPSTMDTSAIVAARALQQAVIRPSNAAQGYLYVVCRKPVMPDGQLEIFRSSVTAPALVSVLVLVILGTGLAAWITSTVTRPLKQLAAAVDQVTREGLNARMPREGAEPPISLDATPTHDEWDQLRRGFGVMLKTLRSQWDAVSRLDHFRREGVSNLSHDLRSPLTATVACLETLEQRCGSAEDRRLVEVALRNTRNAAQLVRSLGELAQLDEPSFQLRLDVFNLHELLDDITMRFADRARQSGIELSFEPSENLEPMARVDIELFERAVANLIDNALKFTPSGGHIRLSIAPTQEPDARLRISVADDGAGIAPEDQPHLFDRFYQSRQSVAPAKGDGGKGLGLAIVQRIAELHEGAVEVVSHPGQGTCITLLLPQARPVRG